MTIREALTSLKGVEALSTQHSLTWGGSTQNSLTWGRGWQRRACMETQGAGLDQQGVRLQLPLRLTPMACPDPSGTGLFPQARHGDGSDDISDLRCLQQAGVKKRERKRKGNCESHQYLEGICHTLPHSNCH